jgi:hypothetical protein
MPNDTTHPSAGLDAALEEALREVKAIRKMYSHHSSPEKRNSRDSVFISKRLELSEDLARRLFARIQVLERKFSHDAKPEIFHVTPGRANEASTQHAEPAENLHRATAVDKAVIIELSTKLRLLESGSARTKLEFAASEIERVSGMMQQLKQDYKILAASRTANEVCRGLADRLHVIEAERSEEASILNGLLFEAENQLCESFVENTLLKSEMASMQKALQVLEVECAQFRRHL